MPDPAFAAWRVRIEAVLERALPAATESPQRLHAAMRHAVRLDQPAASAGGVQARGAGKPGRLSSAYETCGCCGSVTVAHP